MKANKYYTVGTLAGRVSGITCIRCMYVHNQQIGKLNNLRWYPTPDPNIFLSFNFLDFFVCETLWYYLTNIKITQRPFCKHCTSVSAKRLKLKQTFKTFHWSRWCCPLEYSCIPVVLGTTFSQFSGCWLILSVYIIMSFYFPFVRLFGVR